MSDHDSRFGPEIIEELLEQLREGRGMNAICADPRMPHRETIRRWSMADDGLAANIAHAREIGYVSRAEKAVEDAKAAADPVRGRLAFDAERWYLGKLSRAFADKTIHSNDPENPMPATPVTIYQLPDNGRGDAG